MAPCMPVRSAHLRLLSCKLRPAAPLEGNPRALGFYSPPIFGRLLAPLMLQKNLGLRSFAYRSGQDGSSGAGRPLGPARRREMVSRRTQRKDQSHGYHRICHEARGWPL